MARHYEAVLCIFEQVNHFVSIDRRTITSDNGASRPIFTGPYAEPYNMMAQTAFGREKFNYTSVIKKSYGLINGTTGLYDGGCLAALQQDQADLALLYTRFPVWAHGLRQQQVFEEDKLTILSYYTINESSEIVDIFSSMTCAFDLSLWLLIVACIAVFWLIFKCMIFLDRLRCRLSSSRTPEMQSNALYQVLTLCFQVETMDYYSFASRFSSLVATFMTFYVLIYLSNLLNTSMVIHEPPDLVESYDDLLKVPVIRPYFFALQNDYQEFESAPVGSKERKIWQKALANFDRNDFLIKPGLEGTAASFDNDIIRANEKKNKTVAILSRFLSPLARCVMCAAKARFAFVENDRQLFKSAGVEVQLRRHAHISSDPDVKGRMVGAVLNANFKSPLAGRIDKRCIHLFESGLILKVMKLIAKPMMPMDEFNSFQHKVYKDCVAEDYHQNMVPSDDVTALGMFQLKQSLILAGVLISIAFYLLIAEVIDEKVKLSELKVSFVAVDRTFRPVYFRPKSVNRPSRRSKTARN